MKLLGMKFLSVLPALFHFVIVSGQEQVPSRYLHIGFGRSFSGTGDVIGLSYDVRYSEYFKRRTGFYFELGGSIHDGKFPIYYRNSTNQRIDGSIYFTTAGVQLVTGLSQSFLRTKKHELGIRIGLMPRYQSTSYWDWVEVIYPPVSGLPIPVAHFINTLPHRSLSIGGKGQFFYNFTMNRGFLISLSGTFQGDSNGDIFADFGIGFGKRF